jgi:hypothetical protein
MKIKEIKHLLRRYILFNDVNVLKHKEIKYIIESIPSNIILQYSIK